MARRTSRPGNNTAGLYQSALIIAETANIYIYRESRLGSSRDCSCDKESLLSSGPRGSPSIASAYNESRVTSRERGDYRRAADVSRQTSLDGGGSLMLVSLANETHNYPGGVSHC